MSTSTKRISLYYIVLAGIALFIGTLFGPFQALDHARIDLYPILRIFFKSYYQGLSLHGVLNALVWTFAFSAGWLLYATAKALDRDYPSPLVPKLSFALMLVGVVIAAIPLLLNAASVLYTFYPPLQAHWAFYLGLVLVVISTWLVGVALAQIVFAWRREHPGERTPLTAYGALATYVMWAIASMGVAVEVLFLILPWSLGIVEAIDPQLSRTFFWFTGHPLVYFWLLPAYVAWYTLLPKLAGGKLFSDPLARLVFILFIVLSTPVGFHHQYTDPGVPPGWKALHALFTFSLFIPSLLTAFTVIASLEHAGRQRGGTGTFGWLWKLPWGDPVVASMLLAGIVFMFGGISGLINASYNINLVVHNTSFIPGHFHLTVGGGVTMTFMGLTYWLLPRLTGKKLWAPRVAALQAWVYFVGLLIFSRGMHWAGTLGFPRRVPMTQAVYWLDSWNIPSLLTAVGGVIMFVGALLYFLVFLLTLVRQPEEEVERMAAGEAPFAVSLSPASGAPAVFENWRLWVLVAMGFIVVAYGPYLISYTTNFIARGYTGIW
ncbi:MAG: cytochrome C oxidase subunit I [Caldilineae bacterium]|nr:MAG: cytochrome C oxidase subunit I [Caldilineae bacterium]